MVKVKGGEMAKKAAKKVAEKDPHLGRKLYVAMHKELGLEGSDLSDENMTEEELRKQQFDDDDVVYELTVTKRLVYRPSWVEGV